MELRYLINCTQSGRKGVERGRRKGAREGKEKEGNRERKGEKGASRRHRDENSTAELRFLSIIEHISKKYGRVSETLLNWVVHGKCYQ